MSNGDYDSEVARFQRVSSVLLAEQENEALQRALELERGVEFRELTNVNQLFFCPESLESPLVRTLFQEDRPDIVTLQMEHRRRNGRQVEALELSPSALKLALRGETARELLPSLPADLEPVLFVTSRRRVFRHPEGWFVHVDSRVSFHPVDLERPLQDQMSRPSLPAIHRERGAVLTVWEHTHAPRWLMDTCQRLPPHGLLQEGLARLAAHDSRRRRDARGLVSAEFAST